MTDSHGLCASAPETCPDPPWHYAQNRPTERDALAAALEEHRAIGSGSTEAGDFIDCDCGEVIWGDADDHGYHVADAILAALPDRGLDFRMLARVNRERCESPSGFNHPLSGWSSSDWMVATLGELGEAANKVKKLNRVRDGMPGNTETPEDLRSGLVDEIADAVIYLDLLAQSLGVDLGAAVVSKFDRTSAKIGAPHRLSQEVAG